VFITDTLHIDTATRVTDGDPLTFSIILAAPPLATPRVADLSFATVLISTTVGLDAALHLADQTWTAVFILVALSLSTDAIDADPLGAVSILPTAPA